MIRTNRPGRTLVFAWLALSALAPALRAQGTLSCATTASTPTIRAEGFTELVGDIILNCSGGTPTPAGQPIPQVNITIFMNTAITSRLLQNSSQASEALLLIDEPNGLGSLVRQQLACATPSTGCLIDGTGGSTSPYSGASGRPNIFQGVVGGNSVTFFGVPVDPAGNSGHRILRFTNIRANATVLAGGPANGATLVIASIAVSNTAVLPVQNSTPTVASVKPGLSFSVRDATTGAPLSAGISVQQGTSQALSSAAAVALRFTENFPTAFLNRTKSPSPGDPQNGIPGFPPVAESGLTFTIGNQTAGLADSGTRLKATFSGIPAGMRVFVAIQNLASLSQVAFLTVNEAGPFAAVPSTDAAPFGVPVAEIPVDPSSHTATAVWEVVEPNNAASEDYDLRAYFVNAVAPGTVTVSGELAPNAPSFSLAAGGSAQGSTFPIPRFAGGSAALNVLTVTPPTPSVLSSNPVSLTFIVRAGAASVAQTIAVSATGASSALPFTASANGLSALSVPGGTLVTPASLSVALNPAGLAPGAYFGSVILTSAGASNSPLTIPVTLVVTAPPPYISTQTLSHIADGGGWKTTIILLNTGTAPANFTLRFWDESGNPWKLSLGADGTQSQIADTIPVGGSRTIQTDGTPKAVAVGSADLLSAAGTIGGTAVFAFQIAGQPDSEAAVPITTIRGRRFLLPFDNTTGFATGVAVANPSASQTATVSVTFRDQFGQSSGSAGPFSVPAHGHVSFVVPASAGALGVAEFTSPDVDVAGLGIRSHGRTFTSVETLASVLSGGKTISHLADGGGWKTTIILVNAGSQAASFTLRFRQDNGASLKLSLGSDGVVSTLSDTIAPGGSRIVRTDGTASALATGWAELATTFAIGGTAIFGAQIPGQPDSEAAVPIIAGGGTHFVLPFDGSTGFGTGIAFANASSTVSASISVTLRDVSGQQISAVQTNLVPPDGHSTIVFPANAKGVAEISSPNTPISTLGIRSHNGAFTSVRSLVILPEFGDVVAGVKEIVSGGNPGPVQGTNPGDWVTLASGDPNMPGVSSYVLTRFFGQGRVAAVGHEGLLINAQLQNNGLFLSNLMAWLDSTVQKTAFYTTGHGEFFNSANSGPLGTALSSQGFTLQNLPGTISASALAPCSVLIIGNGWVSFTSAEIQAVQDFVSAGGGLLMAGLGWSWLPNNPPLTQNDYPMLKLAQPYGVNWLTNIIPDLFQTFYPNALP